jgi:hypothetical protein
MRALGLNGNASTGGHLDWTGAPLHAGTWTKWERLCRRALGLDRRALVLNGNYSTGGHVD